MKYVKAAGILLSFGFILIPYFSYADSNNAIVFDYTQSDYNKITDLKRQDPQESLNHLLFSDNQISNSDNTINTINNKVTKGKTDTNLKSNTDKQSMEIKPLEIIELTNDKNLKIVNKLSKDYAVSPSLKENNSSNSSDVDISKYSTAHKKIISTAKSLYGVSYVYGGNTTKGLDCSGYVKYCYNQAGINIPRTTYTQIKLGKSINIYDIDIADLIFFDTITNIPYTKKIKSGDDGIFSAISTEPFKKLPSNASHVGIYIGNGKFMHASSYKGKIVVENIDSPYFKNRIIDIKRYI